VQRNLLTLEREVAGTGRPQAEPLSVPIQPIDLVGHDVLEVEVKLLSANTTYQVNSLEVEWLGS
jgi:hypothetical protein